MLNGQLSLTALYFPRATAKRLSRLSLKVAGFVCLGVLVGCSGPTSRAPVVDLSKQPIASSAALGGTYVVKPGDTLYKIARSNAVTIADLRQWNDINDANQLAVGQVLKLALNTGVATSSNSGAVAIPAPITESSPAPLTTESGQTNASGMPAPPVTPPVSTPAAPAQSIATTRAADANLIAWGWPASGPVIQTFTSANKGIDIGGSEGASVVSAADGKVMYSGNGVRGLGNLIIVNHDNGFITAYAHNRALLVKTGETVKRGTKIAEIGQTDTTSSRLHFEIRRQGTPVDPMQYLPAR